MLKIDKETQDFLKKFEEFKNITKDIGNISNILSELWGIVLFKNLEETSKHVDAVEGNSTILAELVGKYFTKYSEFKQNLSKT